MLRIPARVADVDDTVMGEPRDHGGIEVVVHREGLGNRVGETRQQVLESRHLHKGGEAELHERGVEHRLAELLTHGQVGE